jgi:histidine triad (HIT) family protein|tara:strand:+ start:19030 stop:19752 length:723 start_codon:yes stop_codon:yes gene_type:complete
MPEQNISPEQLKALQEKIKNMSPEELRDFQKKQCVFCQIISGKIQAKKVFEDEHVIGILDINPANPGHILLLTKEHYSIMPQLPDDEVTHVFMVVKSLSNTMLRSIDAQGTNIIVANGIAAGQRAQHFMVHIIPRKEKDGINFVLPQKTIEQNEIETIGNKLITSLGGAVEKQQQIPKFTPLPETKFQEPKILGVEPPVQPKVPETPKPTKKAKKQPQKKQESKETGIDLDDIARLLGGK